MLLKFIVPLIGYHTTVTTIHEVGFVGYLLIFFMCILLPLVIGLVLIGLCNNQILFRYRAIRRRRPEGPEPQMYDAIPRFNLENHRTIRTSLNLPQPIQNQPRGRGHGRGGRKNRHQHYNVFASFHYMYFFCLPIFYKRFLTE